MKLHKKKFENKTNGQDIYRNSYFDVSCCVCTYYINEKSIYIY